MLGNTHSWEKVKPQSQAGLDRKKLNGFSVIYSWPTPVGCYFVSEFFFSSSQSNRQFFIQPFNDFDLIHTRSLNVYLFSNLLQLHKPSKITSAPHWSFRMLRQSGWWIQGTMQVCDSTEQRWSKAFYHLAWIQLVLVGSHIRCGFLDGPNKFEITQTTSFGLCLSLWWIVMILQELSTEYNVGTGVHSQLTSRWVFRKETLALPWMEVVGLFPDPTWLWNMQCFMRVALVPVSHVRHQLSVAQIVTNWVIQPQMPESWFLAANTFMIASAMSLNTVEWFSLDLVKLKKSNWRSIPNLLLIFSFQFFPFNSAVNCIKHLIAVNLFSEGECRKKSDHRSPVRIGTCFQRGGYIGQIVQSYTGKRNWCLPWKPPAFWMIPSWKEEV